MTGLLSLWPELLHEIIQLCQPQERCLIRATCKVLNELADPIVFCRLRLFDKLPLRTTEHQIVSLAALSSKACEFTKDMQISWTDDNLRASEQSLPHFGHCDDMRVHLPTAISKLRNLRCFRWVIRDDEPIWLVNSLLQAVVRLPKLTELDVDWGSHKARIPIGLFSNLTNLSVTCNQDGFSSFISQTATAIANSPQLRRLRVRYFGHMGTQPKSSDLFAKTSPKNPLCLEHLSIQFMDATVNEVVLPHLTHLTSFEFDANDRDLATRVWTSFRVNNIKLSGVVVPDITTKESMLYLSSFSGLKKLVVTYFGDMENLFAYVLSKHVNSLQTLQLWGWIFDHTNSSIMSCVKLRDLSLAVDGNDNTNMQLLLDTVAHLPELKILHVWINEACRGWAPGSADFKPKPGLQYVDELDIQYVDDGQLNRRWYVKEIDRKQPFFLTCSYADELPST